MIPYRKEPKYASPEECPQPGKERMVLQQPIVNFTADGITEPEAAMLRHMNETGAVFMMGQNPKLPVMPAKPKLVLVSWKEFSYSGTLSNIFCTSFA